ncbi:hypothetical protein ACSSS7_000670 [Eimeria intestinalis]
MENHLIRFNLLLCYLKTFSKRRNYEIFARSYGKGCTPIQQSLLPPFRCLDSCSHRAPMLSWEAALREEHRAKLSRRIYTLHDAAEDLLAVQNAGGQALLNDEANSALQKIQHLLEEEGEWSAAEARDREQDKRRLKELQETRELLSLQQLLPELLQRGKFKEAEGAVCCFLDRNPRNADGLVLLAEVHTEQNSPIAAIAALWGAVHNCPNNRRLLRLVTQHEEAFLLERCELPLQFKLRALEPPQELRGRVAERRSVLDGFDADGSGAPLVISRQGTHTAAFANKDLCPGDLILTEKPFVCTPLMLDKGQILSSCFHCLREREDPARAFSCPVSPHTCPFVFCSWQCLMKNGRMHSVECSGIPIIFGAAKESGLDVTSVLHIFRTLVKAAMQREFKQPRAEGDVEGDQDPTADVASVLLNLSSYEGAVKQGQPELFERLTLLARRLQRSLPPHLLLHLTENELVHFILVVLQYSPYVIGHSAAAAVQRQNPETTLGRVLAPATAMLHHSCVPTATVSLQEDGRIAVRALTFIPAGGFVCLSVEEDLFKPQKERKAVESPPRVFGCGCLRCTDNEEGGRLLRGIRCPKCIRGFLCPVKGAAMLARLKAYEGTGILTGPMLENVASKATTVVLAAKGVVFKGVFSTKPEKTEASDAEPAIASPLPDEQWLCGSCGLASKKTTKLCEAIERDALERQQTAERFLAQGAHQRARRVYSSLIAEYCSTFHPQHAVLFNAHVILAGLLASQRGRNLPRALILLRRALVAAETVLPPTSMTKVHLYLKLAEITYQTMQLDKHCRRGPSLPPEKILEPLFCALWNCVACLGADASLSVAIGLRLRRFAGVFGVCTPPLLHVPVVRTEDVFIALYRAATKSTTATPEAKHASAFQRRRARALGRRVLCMSLSPALPCQQIKLHFTKDPMFVAVALVRHGLCFPLALELFRAMRGVHHLPTGLSLLGLACLHSQDDVARELLAMGYDLFAPSHLGMTPLLVMCASQHQSLLTLEKPRSRSPGDATAPNREEAQLRILRLMLQHCDALDAKETNRAKHAVKLRSASSLSTKEEPEPGNSTVRGSLRLSRRRLLFVASHRFLGKSHALHFAASSGKARLCRQLLAAGSVVGVLNAENATPLHLACMAGSAETVRTLLDRGADANAAASRGETPLVLAAYWLHADIGALLLERGADCNVVTKAEGLTVLHAIAAGVLRHTRALFRGLAWEGDPAAIALEGLSVESSAKCIYPRKGSGLIPEDALIDTRLPSSCQEDNELFLFPGELLDRMRRAKRLLLTLLPHCEAYTYTHHARSGLSAAELLIHSWESFCSKRNRLLQRGDLRFASLAPDARREVEEQWHFAAHEIYVLGDMLKNQENLTSGAYRSMHRLTPRGSALEEAQHQQLLAAAPWYFPEEVLNATSRRRRNASPAAETTASG